MYRSKDTRTSHHGLFPPNLRFLGLDVEQVHSLGSTSIESWQRSTYRHDSCLYVLLFSNYLFYSVSNFQRVIRRCCGVPYSSGMAPHNNIDKQDGAL